MAQPLSPEFVDRVRELVGRDRVSDAEGDLQAYGKDWTEGFTPDPALIVFPGDTREVSRLLQLCHELRVPVVPSGGRTGLAGGAVAQDGEVVVSLERLRTIGKIDHDGLTLRVGAGVVTEAVHEHCAPHGLTWPIDLASKGSSQVGGNIATNAGGVRVIRHGLTRQWVLGLEVVLPSGEVLELGGALEKNNTGLDLRQLFIGSEGTLGIITAATLKLTRLPGESEVLLLGLTSLKEVLTLLRCARSGPFTLSAFEFFTDACVARVDAHRGLGYPLDQRPPYYALLEVEPAREGALAPWLSELFEARVVQAGTLARDSGQAKRLWEYREAISESLSATGVPHKNDVALPVAALPAFCTQLARIFAERYPDTEICLFGHIGDGNLHINAMKPAALGSDEFRAETGVADRAIFELVETHHGSISAEHGIGLLKKPYLGYSRSPAELTLFRAVKAALDPHGILNPGKVFDP